jgi:fumarylacetoacetase
MDTWAPVDDGSGFTLACLPYGVAGGRVVVRIGDGVVALGDVLGDHQWRDAVEADSLNPVMTLGVDAWSEIRDRVTTFLTTSANERALTPVGSVELSLPFQVGDYVDFYSSIEHATHLGELFRPDAEPLLPNWRHLPVGYHGRSGTVVVSGTPVRRPNGLVLDGEAGVVRRPCARLDIELEVGFVVGAGSDEPIAPDEADRHVFGAVLVNDWSARDIQAFEYQPLGPFLGKSFLTSISAWVVPLAALAPFLVEPPEQEPVPDAALQATRPWAIDLGLSVDLNGATLTRNNFRGLYWTFAQQLAHMTSNGATTRTGDLFASGTVSGWNQGELGSLIEMKRPFLDDGDSIVLRGVCGEGANAVGFGEVEGTVVKA